MDYSKLSDEELMAMANKPAAPAAPDYSKMSDADLMKMAGVSQNPSDSRAVSKSAAGLQGFGQGATFGHLNEAQAAAYSPMEKVADYFGGGDIAKANVALQKQGIQQPEDSYASRLVENKARDQELQKSGAYTPAKIAGSLYSTIVPGMGLSKLAQGTAAAGLLAPAASTAGRVAQAAGAGAAYGALENPGEGETRLENAGIGAATGVAGHGLLGGIKNAGSAIKGGLSELSGISGKVMDTYLERGGKIDQLLKKFPDIQDAADNVRQGYQKAIFETKNKLGSMIGAAMEDPARQASMVDGKSIMERLGSFGNRLNPKLPSSQEKLGALNDIKGEVQSVMGENGQINLKDLHDLKESLQEMAKPAYLKGGQIFERGKEVRQAAKAAAAEVRSLFNQAAPDLAVVNNKLSQLHVLEGKLNKNLITPEKSASALLSAGANGGAGAKQLQRLGDITGKNFLPQAEDLAAANSLGSPKLFSPVSTGRVLLGSTLGGAAGGYHSGAGGAGAGALAGAAASSPAGIKMLLKLAAAAKAPQANRAIGNAISGVNPLSTGVVSNMIANILRGRQ